LKHGGSVFDPGSLTPTRVCHRNNIKVQEQQGRYVMRIKNAATLVTPERNVSISTDAEANCLEYIRLGLFGQGKLGYALLHQLSL
jgi:hypothetical protein